jgi:hypothetical protein
MAEKYVCFRVEDWDKFIKRLSTIGHPDEAQWSATTILENMLPDAVPDAEVFRHQDLVAAPIFYAASSIYQSYIELMGLTLSAEETEYLQGVVEHFFEAAERSKGLPTHKLPD